MSKTVNGVATTYTYDENDRLRTEIRGGDTIVYDYDDNGNLIRRTAGNEVTNYVWDDQNRMVEVQTANETVSYAYDDDNIRVSETVDGTTKSYLLDKNRPYAQVLAEYEDGTEVANYTYGLDLIEQERGGNESYYHVDGLGSTRGLTDESGNVTDTYTYDAYGNVVGVAGTTENDYRFAGEQFDGTLGQYYLRQRYYDPNSGRFTRRDTYEGRLGEPITLHKYLYANADPVNGIDPSGLATMSEIQAVFAHIGQMALRSLPTPLRVVTKFATRLKIAQFLIKLGLAYLAADASGPVPDIPSPKELEGKSKKDLEKIAQSIAGETLKNVREQLKKLDPGGGKSGRSGDNAKAKTIAGNKLKQEASKLPKRHPLREKLKTKAERLLQQGRADRHPGRGR